MLPPPMEGAIIPMPTEQQYNNQNLSEEDIDSSLLASNGFDIDDETPEVERIKVRFKKSVAK